MHHYNHLQNIISFVCIPTKWITKITGFGEMRSVAFRNRLCSMGFFRQTERNKAPAMYIYLVVSILQIGATCPAVLSQCSKLWLLGHRYRIHAKYGLQKEIQNQIAAEIMNCHSFSQWVISINIFLKLNIVSYIIHIIRFTTETLKQVG